MAEENGIDAVPGDLFVGATVSTDGEGRGKILDLAADDFVTHGVIVGMTGSGKTGLGIDLLEEALLEKVPCLVIDPKGDMGNLALIFPELAPSDFAPWMDDAEATRRDLTVDELATETADTWRDGLESWGIDQERMRRLRDGAELVIYTPGSTMGVPLNILGSLSAPPLSWDEHQEDLRDEIEGFVSALLALAGLEADPVSDPAHILLATLVEHEWRAGRDLDLAKLVGMIPQPPVRKLGVFELEEFYPGKKRTALAMKLNALLASPSFASWLEGPPLDIEQMLTGEEGTPVAIVYLAHLSDAERQFVVTLLLTRAVTWMRRQSGTSRLRALIYMDEIFGFAPPVAEPPPKKQILTILKQARAFGVGMVVATQNPMDLDYKAMSNAGLWMVGRLQTENDKKRILEGLADAGDTTDIAAVDTLVSGLDNRQFVLRRAGSAEPELFETRWAMSYLAGPLDRSQVETLTADRPVIHETPDPPPEPAEVPAVDASAPPSVADGITVCTLDPSAGWADVVGSSPGGARAKAIAVATVRLLYDDRYAGVDHREELEAIIDPLSAPLDWSAVTQVDYEPADFADGWPEVSSYAAPDGMEDPSFWKTLERDLKALLVAEQAISVHKNPELSIYSRVGESENEFLERCRAVAEEKADAELAKLEKRYRTKIDRVKDQISKSDRRVAELEADVAARQQQEVVSGVGDLLGSLVGGRSKSAAIRRAASRRAQTQRTAADLDTAAGKTAESTAELDELEQELQVEVTAIVDGWQARADQIESVEIPLEDDDVQVTELRLVWVSIA